MNKRRLTTTLAALLMVLTTAHANPINRSEALKRAQEFVSRQQGYQLLTPATTEAAYGRRRAPSANEEYYVFNKAGDNGYVIVSGDDQTEPILGYTDKGTFDYEQLPPALKALLSDYTTQIATLRRQAPVIRDAVPTHPKVAQLMKSTWSQGYPYNLSCPQYFSLGQSVTGCVATAMAQILYYHRDMSVSETTAAMPAYDTWTSHATYGRLHVEGIPEGSPIDWENMKDNYGSATEKQRKAVADLMHYCGVAVKMDYTNSSSGAQSYDAYQAFAKYFGYGSSVRYVSYTSVTSDTEWDKIIYAEIAAGRPVYVSGSNAEAGHAFVADGYDGNLKYHINWGWGGTSDGYYLLTSLTPGKQGIGGSNDGYTAYREIIVGIEPENYAEKAMNFSDATVKKLCLEKWDADHDGKLTYGEAAAVTDIGTTFQQSAIKTFKELYYFTAVTALPDDAFNGCSQLSAIRLPKNVSAIGQRALKGCSKLAALDMPNHVLAIGSEAFSGCTALKALTLPEELPAIEPRTFYQCSSLSAMTLPITVTAIGDEAFASCTSLGSVTLRTFQPKSITLGHDVFTGSNLNTAVLTVMQGTKSYYATAPQWQQFGTIIERRERSGGQFSTLTAGKKYYLYHAGTGQYLTKGEAWGTQAIVGDTPMRFTLNHTSSMPEGTYYLTSEDTEREGTVLFRTSADANVGNGVMAAFVDGTLSANSANAYWTITSLDDQVYTIQIPANATGYKEGLYWGVLTSHKSNAASPTYGVYSDIDYANHPAACQWRFVLYDEQQDATYNAAAQLEQLLSIAHGRRLKVDAEQAVFDHIESTYDELCAAQTSLRKKLKFIDINDESARRQFISTWDIDSDGELSYAEASKANDFSVSFMNDKQLTTLDELQYFTAIPSLYGNTFEGCSNLKHITLPTGLTHIYYRVFFGCKSLEAINIPELVSTIGDNCFTGCTALHSVTVASPDPSTISLGKNVFSGVKLAECTLYVPFGSKALYEQTAVWKSFGNIVEVRMRTQPRQSAIAYDTPGYLMHVGTRKYLAMGEAYGTQSIVAATGMRYQLKRTKTMAEGLCYLYSEDSKQTGKILFRTTKDSKVGEGVKACFGDGSLGAAAYWHIDSVAPGVYTLQVPSTDGDYQQSQYLGVDEFHQSAAASPTYGVYFDVKGTDKASQWVFITADSMAEARLIDEQAQALKALLDIATERQLDIADERAVYDNPQSSADNLKGAVRSVRAKLRYITFADSRAQAICTDRWDTDGDGELTYEEAAAVTTIGDAFTNATAIKSLEELQYFTALTTIPEDAFRGCSSLHTVYLPAGITAIGEYAFRGCSVLKNIVMLSPSAFIPMGYTGVPNNALLFVPASMVATYSSDADWAGRCTIIEYTGQPTVSAEASRIYGRSVATIRIKVSGAPVVGDALTTCTAATDASLPVGSYPIDVALGSIITPGTVCQQGTLTIEPAPLTVSAENCTRQAGEQNPEFVITYKGFRNRETVDVVTVKPVATCEATADSPAGDYPIIVSGGQAPNYTLIYEPGVLTVGAPTAIGSVSVNLRQAPVYDLQGRRVTTPQRGVFINGNRKVIVK